MAIVLGFEEFSRLFQHLHQGRVGAWGLLILHLSQINHSTCFLCICLIHFARATCPGGNGVEIVCPPISPDNTRYCRRANILFSSNFPITHSTLLASDYDGLFRSRRVGHYVWDDMWKDWFEFMVSLWWFEWKIQWLSKSGKRIAPPIHCDCFITQESNNISAAIIWALSTLLYMSYSAFKTVAHICYTCAMAGTNLQNTWCITFLDSV